MQPIKRLIKESEELFSKKKGANHERAEMIEQLVVFMGESVSDSSRFKYWLGRTRKLKPQEIYALMRKAREGKNPQALFNWLLKKHNEQNSIRASKIL